MDALARSALLPASFLPSPDRVYQLEEAANSPNSFLRTAAGFGRRVFDGLGACSDQGEFIIWDSPSKNAKRFVDSILSILSKQGFRLSTLSKNEEAGYRAARIIRISNAQKPILALVVSYQTALPIAISGRSKGYSAVLWCFEK